MKSVSLHPFLSKKRFGLFEYAVIAIVLLLVAIALYARIGPRSMITVTVRLSDKDIGWADNGSYFVQNIPPFEKGQKETDQFGNTTAEVLDVYSFLRPNEQMVAYGAKQAVYLTMRFAGSYNARANQYRYSGVTMSVGDWVRLTFKSMVINGMIVSINGEGMPYRQDGIRRVKVQIKTDNPPWGDASTFTESSGVDRYVAESLKTGDMVTDSEGNYLAKIYSVTVRPAQAVSADAYGNVRVVTHPKDVEILLDLDIRTRTIGDTEYFLESVPVRVNQRIPLYFPGVYVEGRITEVLPAR